MVRLLIVIKTYSSSRTVVCSMRSTKRREWIKRPARRKPRKGNSKKLNICKSCKNLIKSYVIKVKTKKILIM